MMINDSIDDIPTAYKKLKNKIKNKKVKAVLDTSIDGYVVNKGIELIGERFNFKKMSKVFLILRLKKYLKK